LSRREESPGPDASALSSLRHHVEGRIDYYRKVVEGQRIDFDFTIIGAIDFDFTIIGALNELERLREDWRIGAGECRVVIPEPGTDAARLLSGNVILRQALRRAEQRELEALAEVDELRVERDSLRTANERALVVLDDETPETPLECIARLREALTP